MNELRTTQIKSTQSLAVISITSQTVRKEGHYEVSKYNDTLTKQGIVNMRNKLSKAFPELTAEFYDIFADRLKDNSFTDKRLNDAVNSIIDTCIYPQPRIAQFISFDKKMKLYSYDDVMKMNNEVSGAFERYRPVQIGNLKKPLFASLNDIQENNLVVFKKK